LVPIMDNLLHKLPNNQYQTGYAISLNEQKNILTVR
jgi:hypothetical protein